MLGVVLGRLSRREALGLLGAGAGLGFGKALNSSLEASGWRLGNAGLAAARWQAPASTPTFSRGAVVRHGLRDVSPAALPSAATLFHEHLSFEWPRVNPRPADGRASRP